MAHEVLTTRVQALLLRFRDELVHYGLIRALEKEWIEKRDLDEYAWEWEGKPTVYVMIDGKKHLRYPSFIIFPSSEANPIMPVMRQAEAFYIFKGLGYSIACFFIERFKEMLDIVNLERDTHLTQVRLTDTLGQPRLLQIDDMPPLIFCDYLYSIVNGGRYLGRDENGRVVSLCEIDGYLAKEIYPPE